MNIQLKHIPLPPPAASGEQPAIPAEEYDRRLRALHERAGARWVAVYGDREHSANLVFLCGFDPRFEEALLLLGPDGARTLLVGNEGMGYVSAARAPMSFALAQSFSLMAQPRDAAPRLADALRAAGIGPGDTIGVVGWKYLGADECDDPSAPAFVPAFIADALRTVSSPGRAFDATAALMHPVTGLRATNGAAQIAAFAWAAERASLAVLRIVGHARPGLTEREAFAAAGYEGDPMACHPMMTSNGGGPVIGLRSPSGRRLGYGDGVSTAIGLWGSLCCRAGILAAEPDPAFVAAYVAPYYRAIAAWWSTVRAGVTGGEVFGAVMRALDGAAFRPALNPGHLISHDEWMHSPIFDGSALRLTSGMMLQCDIIPAPMPDGTALNCEDTAAVADAALRAEIAAAHPALWRAIQSRRAFMRERLGIALPDDVLPLSHAPAYFAPYWLADDLVCAVSA